MASATVMIAAPGHAAIVGQLLHDFNAEFETPTPSPEAFTRRFTAMLARDDVLVLLAGEPADAIGFAFVTLRPTPYYDGPVAQLEELYVRPQLRDQGIGTVLLEEAMAAVRARGSAEMHINVDEIDTDTRRFYERHGFTNVESMDGDRVYRMLCYLREL